MATELARQKAAQAWCTDTTAGIEMDSRLAEAFADIIDKYMEALQWCGGSSDFAPKGEARKGWLKIVEPLLNP